MDLSVTQDLNDAWKLYAGATWTRWSRLKDITVNNDGVAAAGPTVWHHHRRPELA
jgi:long-chain fatty acid transport protein